MSPGRPDGRTGWGEWTRSVRPVPSSRQAGRDRQVVTPAILPSALPVGAVLHSSRPLRGQPSPTARPGSAVRQTDPVSALPRTLYHIKW
ncbi:unnamed protein product [Protopolystoma xenopodis]|uniref:Uncharacterized protein n=1 Tax=Protopolystoma xenopodis TaxID=117903 RepID=A0A3S5A8Y2_9PLAT|nr:unnamed protein product [Protopolystoma xenopodis]